MDFEAFQVEKTEAGTVHRVITRSTDDLPVGDVLVRVLHSSVNYKDALSARGMPGVTRNYPHTPGIDAAGVVVESSDTGFTAGDEVIVIGFDLGMDTDGGYGQYIRVPAGWVTPLPTGLSVRDSMVLGTAGLTAGLCVQKLLQMGAVPEDGPVLVSGATGGVGSVAVSLLSHLGFEVVASTGKSSVDIYLKSLGASDVIDREGLAEDSPRPMLKPLFAHAVDTVGCVPLANIIKQLDYGGSVAICGLVASADLPTSVLPFILRNVNVLGIDSVELPIAQKTALWQRLASEWQLDLSSTVREVGLDGLTAVLDQILAGQVTGRTLVTHQD